MDDTSAHSSSAVAKVEGETTSSASATKQAEDFIPRVSTFEMTMDRLQAEHDGQVLSPVHGATRK